MIFYEYFRTMAEGRVVVSLKCGVTLSGVLKAIDPFLNISLEGVEIPGDCPAFAAMRVCAVRGSAIKTIRLSPNPAGEKLLADASRLRCSLGQ
ncbi:U6 snRNA-associated Sm-like protein LSm2 [Pancytospora philotis]|nr:U6 snRNA-associated Sm-like protein LSm2 [Pancytospora philotis]